MLELLMWEPLVAATMREPKMSKAYNDTFSKLNNNVQSAPTAAAQVTPRRVPLIPIADIPSRQSPLSMQATLVEMAKTFGSKAAGNNMAGLIQTCLDCLGQEGELSAYIVSSDRDRKDVAKHFVNIILTPICSIQSVI